LKSTSGCTVARRHAISTANASVAIESLVIEADTEIFDLVQSHDRRSESGYMVLANLKTG